LVALGAVALYFLVIVPWLHRREDSVDLGERLRMLRDETSSPGTFTTRMQPPPSPPAPEGESVESVLTPAEARALLGDPEEPEPGDEDTHFMDALSEDALSEPPPWPTEARHPSDLEPAVALHTGNVGLATIFLLRLQVEGIAYQEMNQVWGSRQIVVPRRHLDDAKRILAELAREFRGGSEHDPLIR
jgi:hypothetical protein